MRAYYHDNVPGDRRLPHYSGRDVGIDRLREIGVLYYMLEGPDKVDHLAKERGYQNRDEIVISPAEMGDGYEEKAKMFFNEHLHEDEEIRYIRDGRGYFDVRSKDDKWVRIDLKKNDLIILPPGIYHRFTTDESNFVRATRLFKDEPKWTPLNRSSGLDANHVRQDYVERFLST